MAQDPAPRQPVSALAEARTRSDAIEEAAHADEDAVPSPFPPSCGAEPKGVNRFGVIRSQNSRVARVVVSVASRVLSRSIAEVQVEPRGTSTGCTESCRRQPTGRRPEVASGLQRTDANLEDPVMGITVGHEQRQCAGHRSSFEITA